MASEGRMAQLVTFASAFKEGGREMGNRLAEAYAGVEMTASSRSSKPPPRVEMKADGKSLRAIAARTRPPWMAARSWVRPSR